MSVEGTAEGFKVYRDPNIKALKRRGFINHGST